MAGLVVNIVSLRVGTVHWGVSASTLFPRSSTRLAFKTFDEMLVELEMPVLVDFYAQWCGPCKMMVPVLEEIAARLENDIKVAKVDTDRSPTLGNRYQVEALPTLILFNKGQPVERYVGYMSADELERAVTSTLKRIRGVK
jgi:thioredoxin